MWETARPEGGRSRANAVTTRDPPVTHRERRAHFHVRGDAREEPTRHQRPATSDNGLQRLTKAADDRQRPPTTAKVQRLCLLCSAVFLFDWSCFCLSVCFIFCLFLFLFFFGGAGTMRIMTRSADCKTSTSAATRTVRKSCTLAQTPLPDATTHAKTHYTARAPTRALMHLYVYNAQQQRATLCGCPD